MFIIIVVVVVSRSSDSICKLMSRKSVSQFFTKYFEFSRIQDPQKNVCRQTWNGKQNSLNIMNITKDIGRAVCIIRSFLQTGNCLRCFFIPGSWNALDDAIIFVIDLIRFIQKWLISSMFFCIHAKVNVCTDVRKNKSRVMKITANLLLRSA